MTDRELLHRIERSAGHRAGYKQLVRELGLGGGRERRMLLEQLDRMTARGELVKSDRDHWALPQAAARNNLVAGRLDVHRDGFGFVRPETRQASGDDDIFIPPNEMNGAMQGDQVLVELAPPRADGRRSGRIARVLTRRNPTVVGIFHYALHDHAMGNTVTPLDERVTQPILIPFGLEQAPATGAGTPHRVLSCKYRGRAAAFRGRFRARGDGGRRGDHRLAHALPCRARPRHRDSGPGRTISVSTSKSSSASTICPMFSLPMFSRRRALPPTWMKRKPRAAAISAPCPSLPSMARPPRTSTTPVFVRQHGGGEWELQVHIADVAQYVAPGSALDLEARLRGTSVYFPDRAVPMLPQELSSDICSLRPGEDRLVLSCIMMIDPDGEIRSYEVTQGVIRSTSRMTYTQVHAVLGGDQKAREQFAPVGARIRTDV